jgi:uncharacterized membrane protein
MINRKYLIILSIIGYGCWSFFTKIASKTLHPLQIHTINYCIGIALLPVYLYMISTKVSQPFDMKGVSYAVLASLSSISASLMFLYIIRSSNSIGSFSALISASPAITLVLSVLFLGEEITVMKIIGITMIVLGVGVLSR